MKESYLLPALEDFIKHLDFSSIPVDRAKTLRQLANYIQSKITKGHEVRLNMICTHNSRRSHLAQVWAQTAAAYYRLSNVTCYSGGTEATAMYPTVAHTLANTGFHVAALSEGANPIHSVKYAVDAHPVIGFSKKFDDAFNPASQFGAIMTCSHADDGCPFIAGAEFRIAIPYGDPKEFDQTSEEADGYALRSLQIATEMSYVFSLIRTDVSK